MAILPLEKALEMRDPSTEAMVACRETLEGCDSDPWDVAEIFEKLREWLRRDLGLAQKCLGEASLQSKIVLALRRHGRANLEVARLGLGAIASCCQKNDRNADIMLRAGVVQEILTLMDTHCSDTVAQDNACVALWRLAERHGTGADQIAEAGGVQRLFRAMEDHAHNPFVQVNGCVALERLYIRGAAPADGMHEAAQKAMERHPNNIQIKRGAARLLEALQRQLLSADALEVPCNAPDPCRSRPEESTRESLAEASSLAQPLHEWLLELDSVGFLMDYHSSLKQRHFSCPAEVAKAYAQGGRLDDRFFRDLSVRKLGHRRLFEKWCRGLVSEHLAASR
ncbi:unnamed protein product [Polarella glacialis]|uniref:Uncharacterized protein n=1 Tax=Polarella glacialis TaxID=89957 RepID=A0A813HBA4_POLGL|nr:unnamed protein product [Polarella glacialis]